MHRLIIRMFSARLWRWHDRLAARNYLFGSPVTDERKLWSSVKYEIIPLLKRVRNGWLVKIMTAVLRLRLKTVKPVTPVKKFFLVKEKDPSAEKAKALCIESAERYEENRNLEIVTMKDFDSADFFDRHRLTWNERDAETSVPFAGTKIFSVHYKLWLDCVKLDGPVMVIQQGVTLRSRVPALRFKHVLVLAALWTPSELKGKEAFYPDDSLQDAYCYLITPEGARALIKAARRNLVGPVGKFICKRYVDIICCTRQFSPVSFNKQIAERADIVKPQEEVWEDYGPRKDA